MEAARVRDFLRGLPHRRGIDYDRACGQEQAGMAEVCRHTRVLGTGFRVYWLSARSCLYTFVPWVHARPRSSTRAARWVTTAPTCTPAGVLTHSRTLARTPPLPFSHNNTLFGPRPLPISTQGRPRGAVCQRHLQKTGFAVAPPPMGTLGTSLCRAGEQHPHEHVQG